MEDIYAIQRETFLQFFQHDHDYISPFPSNTSQIRASQVSASQVTTSQVTTSQVTTSQIYVKIDPINLGERCSICYEHGIDSALKNCKHEFHLKCIDTWLKMKHTCPVCRSNVHS